MAGEDTDIFGERTKELSRRISELESKIKFIDTLSYRVKYIERYAEPDVYILHGKKYIWKPTIDKPLRLLEVDDDKDK